MKDCDLAASSGWASRRNYGALSDELRPCLAEVVWLDANAYGAVGNISDFGFDFDPRSSMLLVKEMQDGLTTELYVFAGRPLGHSRSQAPLLRSRAVSGLRRGPIEELLRGPGCSSCPTLLQGAEAMDETLPYYGTGSVVTQLVTQAGNGQRSAEGWGPSDLRGRYKT